MAQSYGNPMFNVLRKCQNVFKRKYHFISSLTACKNLFSSLKPSPAIGVVRLFHPSQMYFLSLKDMLFVYNPGSKVFSHFSHSVGLPFGSPWTSLQPWGPLNFPDLLPVSSFEFLIPHLLTSPLCQSLGLAVPQN